MTRDEKVKQLYLEVYEDDTECVSISDMEDALGAYYSAAGVEFESIDDLFENNEVSQEFIEKMESKISEALGSLIFVNKNEE